MNILVDVEGLHSIQMGRKKGSVGLSETKWKEALKRLLDGESYEKLREAYSQSVLYTALNEFFKQAPKEIADQQRQLTELRSSVSTEQKNLSKIMVDREAQEKAAEEAKVLRVEAEASLRSTEEARKKAMTNYTSLVDKWVALGKRGVTEKNMNQVFNLGLDGEQLLTRTTTAEGYQEVLKEYAMKKAETWQLTNQKKDLQAEVEGLKNEAAGQKELGDIQRRQNQAFERDLNLVKQYRAEGYDYEIQVSIFNAVKAVSVKGDPKRSAMNLADAVAISRSFVDLEENLQKLIAEINVHELILKDPRTNLNSLGNRVYKQLDDATKEACKKIEDAGVEIAKSIEDVTTTAVTGVKDVTEYEKTLLEKYVQSSINQLTKDADSLFTELITQNTAFHQDTQNFIVTTEKYGALKEVMGKWMAVYEKVNEIGAIIQRPEAAVNVNPITIQQVALAIYHWTIVKMKDVDHTPSELLKKIEPNQYAFSGPHLRIPTIAYWLYEAIQQHINTTLIK